MFRVSQVLGVCFWALVCVLGEPSMLFAQETPLKGESVGHFQMGVALFDRTGGLAKETEARGFAPFGGPTLRIGFVHYLEALPWLGFGGGVRGTFGNSASGDREYYYNPIFTSGTIGARYPVGPGAFNFAVDLGFTNILAKSRVINPERVDIFHEYGIGPGVGALMGYRLELGSWGTAATLSVTHSRHWVGVELDGGESKSWALGTTAFLGGLEW